MSCAGSIRLIEESDAQDKPNEYKQNGSAAHEIAARALSKMVDPDLWLDTIVEVEDAGEKFLITITEEMVEAAQTYVNYVWERRALYESKGFEIELYVETRFNLAKLNPPAPMYGTADTTIVARRGDVTIVEVIDFKYGQGVVVEIDENSQLRYYSLGAVLTIGTKPSWVRTAIVQPRAPHPDGIIRSESFDYDTLVTFKKELFERARATQDPNAPLVPGDHCTFCPALAVCPAQHSLAVEAAQTEFSNLPVVVEDAEIEVVLEEGVLPIPEALEPEQLREVLDRAPLMEAWLKAVRNHVRDLTEAGMDLGYKLVPKRGTRRWVDADASMEHLISHVGIEEYQIRKDPSPAQAEKMLKEIGLKLPEEMWVMISSGTNLVPNTDPRDALPPAPSAEDEFAEYMPLVEEGYVPDTSNAASKMSDDIEEPMWAVVMPDGYGFTVKAANETDARREARLVMGTDRLPNHTTVSRI
jgi:hypothetical protein